MAAQVPAHAWVTTDTGLLKAVNLAKRTATNFYDGAQPSKEEAIKYMTSPTKHSLLTISQNGKVKKFENGKFQRRQEQSINLSLCLCIASIPPRANDLYLRSKTSTTASAVRSLLPCP